MALHSHPTAEGRLSKYLIPADLEVELLQRQRQLKCVQRLACGNRLTLQGQHV